MVKLYTNREIANFYLQRFAIGDDSSFCYARLCADEIRRCREPIHLIYIRNKRKLNGNLKIRILHEHGIENIEKLLKELN